jgi:hypothetical protein
MRKLFRPPCRARPVTHGTAGAKAVINGNLRCSLARGRPHGMLCTRHSDAGRYEMEKQVLIESEVVTYDAVELSETVAVAAPASLTS